MVQQIERQLTQNAEVQFEYVFLGQVNLQSCRGCYVCQSRGEQYCPLKDERAALVAKMQQADGVIFVSPVYTFNVSGLMKNFMDRIAYTVHRPAFLGKPAILVTSGSLETAETLKILAWFSNTGFEIVSRLGIPAWPSPHLAWRGGKAVDQRIEKAVRRFEQALTHPPVSLSLGKVINFYAMKATAVTDPTFFAADADYHQDINQLDIKVSDWKKRIGQVYYWMAMKWLSRRLVPL
jgi:NAD(P)H-dependent FMN reductase